MLRLVMEDPKRDRWPDDRLDDRFNTIDEGFKDLQYHIRVLAPLSAQTGILESKVEDLRVGVVELRKESRGEVLRVLFALVGVFAVITGGAVLAVLTGLVNTG